MIKGSYLDASFDESGEVFLDFEGDSAIIINLTDIDVNKRHNLWDLNDTTYAGYTSEQIIQAAVEYHKMNHPWKKMMNKGIFPEERLERFNKLLELAEKYRRLNQHDIKDWNI